MDAETKIEMVDVVDKVHVNVDSHNTTQTQDIDAYESHSELDLDYTDAFDTTNTPSTPHEPSLCRCWLRVRWASCGTS